MTVLAIILAIVGALPLLHLVGVWETYHTPARRFKGALLHVGIAAPFFAGALFFAWEPLKESWEESTQTPEISAKEAASIARAYARDGQSDARLRSIGGSPDDNGKAKNWNVTFCSPATWKQAELRVESRDLVVRREGHPDVSADELKPSEAWVTGVHAGCKPWGKWLDSTDAVEMAKTHIAYDADMQGIEMAFRNVYGTAAWELAFCGKGMTITAGTRLYLRATDGDLLDRISLECIEMKW